AALAAMYGFWRVVGFHPLFLPEYRKWLANTPWRSSKALPLKPIGVVWQDVVVLIIIALPGLGDPIVRLITASMFVAVVTLGWTLVNWLMRRYQFVYASFTLLSAASLSISMPSLAFAMLTIACTVAYLGVRNGLYSFPWPDDAVIYQRNEKAHTRSKSSRGWPYGPLLHDRWDPTLTWPHACGVGLTIVALVLASGFGIRSFVGIGKGMESMYMMFAIYALPISLIARLGAYRKQHAPPISFLGRLATWRWIIPGYDVAFLAPLLAAAIALVGSFASVWLLGEFAFVGLGVTLGLTATILLGMGPSLEEWRQTGHHRITAGSSDRRTYEPLTHR
ncbi:MAG: hypothetical protein ACR2NU_04225, partial [Aeoliella sp.]